VRSPVVDARFPELAGLHHFAYRCRDAEETRHFYEDTLGLPLVVAVAHDRVPSSGEEHPYLHIFFALADGSMLAFFDLFDARVCEPDPATPPWVNHLALRLADRRGLDTAKERLEAEGVDVVGPVDHGWFDSIYFFDPNGVRLELVSPNAPAAEMVSKRKDAHEILRETIAERSESS
jgi:catechol 2,3-dioxygenase-like lactoylglutathione lyase family enzyme